MSVCRRAACASQRKALEQVKASLAELLGRNDALNHVLKVLVEENRRLRTELDELDVMRGTTDATSTPSPTVAAIEAAIEPAKPEEWVEPGGAP